MHLECHTSKFEPLGKAVLMRQLALTVCLEGIVLSCNPMICMGSSRDTVLLSKAARYKVQIQLEVLQTSPEVTFLRI